MLTVFLYRALKVDDLIPFWIIGFCVIAFVRPIVLGLFAVVIVIDLIIFACWAFWRASQRVGERLSYRPPAPLPRLPARIPLTRAEQMQRGAAAAKDEFIEMIEILEDQPLDEDELECFRLLEKQRLVKRLEDLRNE